MVNPNRKITRTVYRVEGGTGYGWTGDKGKVPGHTVFTSLAKDLRTLKEARDERKRQLPRWADARIVKITTTEQRKLIR